MLLLSSVLALLPIALGAALPNAISGERSSQSTPNELHSLSKRAFNGRATFYDVGLGACGQYNVASDYIVALNSAQYGGGYPGPNCFKSITIQYGGKTATATIMDQCPTCGYGDLDFSRSLFNHFSGEDAGQFQMTWWFNDGTGQPQPTSTTPTSTYTPPPPTSTYTPPTSTYTPPTSTYTPPTSTYTPPASTSSAPAAVAAAASSSSTEAQGASSASGSVLASASASASASGLKIAVMSSVSVASATTISGSVVPLTTGTAGAGGMGALEASLGNLALLNQAVTNYGNIVVVGAQA